MKVISRLSLWRTRHGKTSRAYGPVFSLLLLGPLAALLLGFFFYPVGRLLATSVWDPSFTLAHYERLYSEPLYLGIMLRTLRIAFLVTAIGLVLGYPAAFLLAGLHGWKLTLAAACVLVPLWTSTLVRSYAWTVLLQRNGLLNRWLLRAGIIDAPLEVMYTEVAVLIAMAHVLLPYMILPIFSALRRIPKDLILAAEGMGAGHSATFRYVVLPLSIPGLATGSVIVFILALGFFITPALLGGPRTLMISTLISQQATELLNWPFTGAISAVLLAVTVGLVLVFHRALRLGRVIADEA